MTSTAARLPVISEDSASALERLDREDLVKLVKTMLSNGVALTFHGKRAVMEISRRVRPRVTRREPKLHVGDPEEQAKNLLIEGENLQAMVTLYKYRGQVDLILTDPPYNTGQFFRYNDKWDEDPNDPELGTVVPKEDGSRHTKWIKAMMPRLQMMRAMLKPTGVIAMCIDDNELFHLGMLMDEVFGEENRLGLLNWQKTTVKNDRKHVSSTTEYVLVYGRDQDAATTGMLGRSSKSNSRFSNPDRDVLGDWRQGDLTARGGHDHPTMLYQVQSPFTGELHPPMVGRHWANEKSQMKAWLEEWKASYHEKDIRDGRRRALVIRGAPLPGDANFSPDHPVLKAAREAAEARLEAGSWPVLYFGHTGITKPMMKIYLSEVKAGAVPTSFWVEVDDTPVVVDSVSWDSQETGRSREGIEELDSIVGKGHGFQTVKPMKLFKKIIQLWCPPSGLVLDPYAGSGTTGHAVLELNQEAGAARRFILVEQGSPENGDKYARSLTWKRLHNAITGERPSGNGAPPLGGGLEFRMLTRQIDAKTVLSMKKDELVDVVITSHWDDSRRGGPNLVRIEDPKYAYLVGKDDRGEGYFIIWNNGDPVGQLDRESYRIVLKDAEKAELNPPYNVYARYEVYQSPNVQFWKIPDKILAHLGLNENSDRFNEGDEEAA
jgi:adenine-specific DNA-methyltransferase